MDDKNVNTIFLHCLRCMKDGKDQQLEVILVDQNLLVIACGSHTPPMHVCSVKVPLDAFIFTNPFRPSPPAGHA